VKDVHGGIARFKRHLAGAFTKGKKSSAKCMRVTRGCFKGDAGVYEGLHGEA
jgi:hypothetical protein